MVLLILNHAQTTINWAIDIYGNYVLPPFIYVWFRDAESIVYGAYVDDIIMILYRRREGASCGRREVMYSPFIFTLPTTTAA